MAKSMLRHVFAIAIAIVLTAHFVQTGPVIGQGTREATLKPHDLDGTGVTDAGQLDAIGAGGAGQAQCRDGVSGDGGIPSDGTGGVAIASRQAATRLRAVA